ncbi:MAG: T9SS type A sorting domain-containing protein [candidate division WOR-3 bacterium]|nr:MAG: T9SS type A sorting domain-containing protein [candidate division WOR-3 bacterium]
MKRFIILLVILVGTGFSVSLWTEEDFVNADSIPREFPVMQSDVHITRGEWQRWSYIHELCQTAAFVASMQVSDSLDPEFGGIIEGEDALTVVETDNTQQAIWVWCRYYQITGDTTYFENIRRAWMYVMNFPSYLEGSGESIFYGVWNCGLALFAESMYRNTIGDTTYRPYADTCVGFMLSNPLDFTGVSSYYQRLHPKVQSLVAGMLYQYGKEMSNQAWKDTAVAYGTRVREWIEANPDTNINDEVWAMSGGTAVWGLCRSIFDADTSYGISWLNVYLPYMKYFQPTGTWNNSWNIWYANAYNHSARITQNLTYVDYHHSLTDSLLVQDYDDDGGVPPTRGWTQYQDHSWVSNYMVFMGFEGLMDSIREVDAGVNAIYATGQRPFFLEGDTIALSMRAANYGFQPLQNAYFGFLGAHSGDTIIDMQIGGEDSIALDGTWIPGDTGYFAFNAYSTYPHDGRLENDTFATSIYVQPLRQLAGNVSDTLNGNGVYARLYFQFVDATGTDFFDSTLSDSVTGNFSVYLIDSLYRIFVETRIPYPELVVENIYVTPESISVVDIGTSPADILIVNRDNEERYAEFYTVCLDTLNMIYKVWAPASQGLFPISRIDEFNANTIIWYTGRAAVNTVTSAEQDSLIQFLDDGGKLIITGQNIGEEISGTSLYENWLHAQLINDSISVTRCYADTLDSLGQGLTKIFTVGSAPSQYSRDVIASDGSAHEFLFYDTLHTNCAAIWYNSTFPDYRVIYSGFGLEAVNQIPGHMSLTEVLAVFLDWFDVLSVEENLVDRIPISLLAVYPNPVTRRMLIMMGSPVIGELGSLFVYDITGRLVRTLHEGELPDVLMWHLEDDIGRQLANGVYFLKLRTKQRSDIVKVVIVD